MSYQICISHKNDSFCKTRNNWVWFLDCWVESHQTKWEAILDMPSGKTSIILTWQQIFMEYEYRTSLILLHRLRIVKIPLSSGSEIFKG